MDILNCWARSWFVLRYAIFPRSAKTYFADIAWAYRNRKAVSVK